MPLAIRTMMSTQTAASGKFHGTVMERMRVKKPNKSLGIIMKKKF